MSNQEEKQTARAKRPNPEEKKAWNWDILHISQLESKTQEETTLTGNPVRIVTEGEKTTMVVGVSTNKTDVPRKTGTEGERAHLHEEPEWTQKWEESTQKKVQEEISKQNSQVKTMHYPFPQHFYN